MLTIRPAVIKDLPAITEIYNRAILNTVTTFDTEPKTLDEQKAWFNAHGPGYPLLVALQDDVIVGWAALSMWSDRGAYSITAEMALYVKEDQQGRGIGRRLGVAIVQAGREAGLHTVIARIAEGNRVSVHMGESLGFRHIGIMKEVGSISGRLLDVYLMQKIYDKE